MATNKTPDPMTITNKGEQPPPIQRIATELRVRIFGLALGHSAPLSAADGREPINTSLLQVSKQFHEEGLDAFYEVNTVRFHDPASINALSTSSTAGLFRNLEFIHPQDNFGWAKFLASSHCKNILKDITQNMPKLKTMTFACEVGRRKITVRQILARAGIADLKCTDIGEFQLGGELVHVRIKMPCLVAAWDASRRSAGTDWMQDLEDGVQEYGSNLDERPNVHEEHICNAVARKNPHIWIILHGGAEGLQNGFMQRRIELLRDQGQEVAAQIYEAMATLASIFEIVSHEGIGPRIRQLNGTGSLVPIDVLDRDSEPKLLEWATELLALNLLLTPGDIVQNDRLENDGVFACWTWQHLEI